MINEKKKLKNEVWAFSTYCAETLKDKQVASVNLSTHIGLSVVHHWCDMSRVPARYSFFFILGAWGFMWEWSQTSVSVCVCARATVGAVWLWRSTEEQMSPVGGRLEGKNRLSAIIKNNNKTQRNVSTRLFTHSLTHALTGLVTRIHTRKLTCVCVCVCVCLCESENVLGSPYYSAGSLIEFIWVRRGHADFIRRIWIWWILQESSNYMWKPSREVNLEQRHR